MTKRLIADFFYAFFALTIAYTIAGHPADLIGIAILSAIIVTISFAWSIIRGVD